MLTEKGASCCDLAASIQSIVFVVTAGAANHCSWQDCSRQNTKACNPTTAATASSSQRWRTQQHQHQQ
jgi:putative ribosome biogenesis GTPase RsgA